MAVIETLAPETARGALDRRHAYLLEVQGLRTVAALLVAVYHVWLHRVSGGVDVFLVVAAYFMVAALLRREPVGMPQIVSYYASTVRRVVPGAVLVIVATVAAALVLMPDVFWRNQAGHAIASALFQENAKLAGDATDYLTQRLSASPFQQMWALSVQMQVYALFPLLYLVCSFGARLAKRSRRLVLSVGFGLVFVLSLAYSISFTNSDQAAAYFRLEARLWEFAAGALLALWIDHIRLPRRLAQGLGWAALLLLLGLGLIVDVSRQFPGFLAGLPVLAAVLIIVASANDGRIGVLCARPLVGFANMSFAFYLWHWPLLVFMRYQTGSADVGVFGGLAVLAGAAVLAFLSTRYVENPVRRVSWLSTRALASFAACAAMLVLAWGSGKAWEAYVDYRSGAATEEVAKFLADPAAYAFAPGATVPATIIARADSQYSYLTTCQQSGKGKALKTCLLGDTEAARTIVLVGGSHSAQYLPALDLIGKSKGYRVVQMTKSSCVFTVGAFGQKSCPLWNEAALAEIIKLQPDLVVTLSTRSSERTEEFLPQGYPAVWKRLAAEGIRVLAIRDNPRFPFDPGECVARGAAASTCSIPRAKALQPLSPAAGVRARNVRFVDFTDVFCEAETCPVVRNNVLMYRDDDHLTRTIVMLLADRLGKEITQAMKIAVTPKP